MYYYSPYRKEYAPDPSGPCAFCKKEVLELQAAKNMFGKPVRNSHYVWLINWFPRCEAHTLIVPIRHITSLAEETKEEVYARQSLTLFAEKVLRHAFPDSGVEIFFQTGRSSLATVPHIHWHIFPALPADQPRGFEKMGYFSTTEPDKERVVLSPIPIKLGREDLIEALRPHITEE